MKAEGGNLKPEMHKPQLSSFSFQPSTFNFQLHPSAFNLLLSAFNFQLSTFYFYSHLYATSAKNLSVRRKYKPPITNEAMAVIEPMPIRSHGIGPVFKSAARNPSITPAIG